MNSPNELDDFISNLLMGHDLSQYTFRADVIPNVLDQWGQNFQYSLGPTNPAFIDATLS